MPIPTEIQIAPLDFDTVRANLKQFLQNQNTLKDYNFDGSALSILIDALAYDAYFHGWYVNFAVNEAFLPTAQIRNSVVAAARQVGYIPRSAAGALAVVDITVGGLSSVEGAIVLPKYSPFNTTVSGNTYTFYTVTDQSIRADGNSTVRFSEVELYEGTKLQQVFTVGSNPSATSFTLLNQNVDTRTMTVSVRPNQSSNTSFVFERATSAVTVNATSNVYFLFETNEGTWELQFGDGRLGRSLVANQVVTVDYLNTRGNEGNGANTFTYAGSALGNVSPTTNVSVTLNNVNVPAYGGAVRETIASIKRSAPNIYQTQGRVVTASDARAVLLAEVSGIDSVSVWGGEDNDPPTYGTLFVAIKPVNAQRFGPTQKNRIKQTILQPKSLPTLAYEMVDPDYIYVVVDTQVRYSPGLTVLSAEGIRGAVTTAIGTYAQDELGQFGSYFRYSKLMTVIDKADPSIQSNLTRVVLEKRITINTSAPFYTVKFGNPIYQPDTTTNVVSVTTRIGMQLFSHPDFTGLVRRSCYVENDGNKLHVYRDDAAGNRILTYSNVGTVDFENGKLNFTAFRPTNVTTNLLGELRIRVIPRESDIVPSREQIILIPADNIIVTPVSDLLNRTNTTFGRVTAGGALGSGGF